MAHPKYPLLMSCKPVALAVMLALGGVTPASAQMPTGGQVVVPGSATINTGNSANYVVTQHGDKAIINWDSFSIGAGNSVRFVQPGANSVVLNRVTGNDLSRIFGTLSSNGQIFLVNPNGVYFAPGASLDVGGLLATTLNIRDSDFLAGRYLFTRGDAAARAEVINAGLIRAREGGYVVLAGDYAANRGVIEARLGTILLGSANQMTLDIHGDSLVSYAMNERNLTELAGVANSGQLMADGGRVVMTAMTARSLTGAAVNNSGLIQARGVEDKGGAVYLLADNADIALGSGSNIDVSGAKGGGTVLVGGNWQGSGSEVQASNVSMAADTRIKADATDSGDGGKVVLWSTGATDFKGSISARGGANGGDGGNVEVSGKKLLGFAGTVDTRAPQGKTGTLLLDPTNITISTAADTAISCSAGTCSDTGSIGTSNLNITTLQAALAGSNVLVTTSSGGTADGNITIQNALAWSSGNMLTLQAANQILINATVTSTIDATTGGALNGTLVLNAGNGVTQSAAVRVANLLLKGGGTFALNHQDNAVNTLAANTTGYIGFRNARALNIGNVDGVSGVTTGNTFSLRVNGALDQTDALKVGALELHSDAGAVTLNDVGNSITALAAETNDAFSLRNSSAILYIQTIGAKTGINTHNNNFTLINANTLQLGNGALDGRLNAGSGVVDLSSNRIVQTSKAKLTADQLVLRTTNYAGLSGTANSVNRLAVVATGAGGGNVAQSLDFLNDKAIVIGEVNGVAGISTQNAHAKVQAYGNITLDRDINLGSGHLALVSQNGNNYGDIDTQTRTVTAGGLAAIGRNLLLDRDANGVNNASGKINTNAVAIRSGGGFAWTAMNTADKSLTVSSNIWGYSGINASGNVYLKTGTFTGYALSNPVTDYYDAAAGKYKAGLVLEGGIAAGNNIVYLDSASGVFQWANDNATGTARDVSKITAGTLLLSGQGQFNLMTAQNAVSRFAAEVTGSIMYSNNTKLTVDTYGINAFGLNRSYVGVKTHTQLFPDDSYLYNGIQLSAADNPDGDKVAMDIRQSIVADTAGGASMINLSVAASDTHKDALVRTSGSAVVQGDMLVLGAAANRGTFEVKSKVGTFSAAGGQSMYVDNTAWTGSLTVAGLGTAQGGGSPTPIGNMFLTTGGKMLLVGGKSTGNYLQLRATDLEILTTMEMKDGARVLLQPLDMNSVVGINNASGYGLGNPTVGINYSNALLQKFSQTAAVYIGSTPALMNQDAAVPTAVKNLQLTNRILIAGQGPLDLGYRSLSAETSYTGANGLWAGNIGNVFNLRLVAPSVSVQGFNVTGTQVHFFADTLSMPSGASSYKLAANTEVTLRGFRNRTIWLGQCGNGQEVCFSEALLKKFPDGSTLIISGSTDQPLQYTGTNNISGAMCDGCVDIHFAKGGQFSLGNRKLLLSTQEDIYGYTSNGVQAAFNNNNYSVATWNANNNPKLDSRSSDTNSNNSSSTGKAGGTWGGCANYATCQGDNPSKPTGPGGNPVTPINPGNPGGGGTDGTGGGNNTPSPPPAPPPSDPTDASTGNATNTGNNNNGNTSGNTPPSGNTPGDTGGDGTPNDGMNGGGPSGNGNNTGTNGNTGGGTPGDGSGNDSTGNTSGSTPGSGQPGDGSGGGTPGDGSGNDGSSSGNSGNSSGTAGDGSGNGSGSGDGSGSGSGSGSSGGTDGSGSGSGKGDGTGGDGSSGDNSGSSSGTDGDGSGTGSGSGDGSGKGSGSGDGSDSGSGSGKGDGDGSDGSGSGKDGSADGSSGRGDDDGSGSGSGKGDGDGGDGSGSGRGKSDGDGSDSGRGEEEGSGGGSKRGDREAEGEGRRSGQQEVLCVGQQAASHRNTELPESGAALDTRPLVEVRNGGVNMDGDCSKQNQRAGGASRKSGS